LYFYMPNEQITYNGGNWMNPQSYSVSMDGGGGSNNAQPTKKPPCKASTRIAGALKAVDGAVNALAMADMGAVHYGLAIVVVAVTCGTPEPVEPVACGAGVFGGGVYAAGGTVLFRGAYNAAKNEMIPGIEQAVSCEEE